MDTSKLTRFAHCNHPKKFIILHFAVKFLPSLMNNHLKHIVVMVINKASEEAHTLTVMTHHSLFISRL